MRMVFNICHTFPNSFHSLKNMVFYVYFCILLFSFPLFFIINLLLICIHMLLFIDAFVFFFFYQCLFYFPWNFQQVVLIVYNFLTEEIPAMITIITITYLPLLRSFFTLFYLVIMLDIIVVRFKKKINFFFLFSSFFFLSFFFSFNSFQKC